MRWYVAQIYSGLEALAISRLDRQEFPSYFPKINDDGRDVPLFRGYLFVSFDVEEPGWGAINNTRGVVKLLPKESERPRPLPIGFVEDLRTRVESGAWDEDSVNELLDQYALGEFLMVLSGPWFGQIGQYVKKKRGQLGLSVPLLGKKVELFVAAHQVVRSPECNKKSGVRAPQYGRRSRGAGAAAS